MTANVPHILIGCIIGLVIGSLVVENSEQTVTMKKTLAEHNQLVAECEATLPRNVRCELIAKEIK